MQAWRGDTQLSHRREGKQHGDPKHAFGMTILNRMAGFGCSQTSSQGAAAGDGAHKHDKGNDTLHLIEDHLACPDLIRDCKQDAREADGHAI